MEKNENVKRKKTYRRIWLFKQFLSAFAFFATLNTNQSLAALTA